MNNEMHDDLRRRFRHVFDAKWDRSELSNYDDLREKFAFHMADIATNLRAIADAYDVSHPCDTKCQAERTFFSDCMPHLIAAAQIYDEIPQIFKQQQGVHDWKGFVDDQVAAAPSHRVAFDAGQPTE